MNSELESSTTPQLDFQKLSKIAALGLDVVPAVAQDARTGEVLIIGYANQLALEHTLTHRVATFWSTSRNELWVKGATSGDTLEIVEIRVNCEQNALLYKVIPQGKGACHTRNSADEPRKSCFYRILEDSHSLSIDPST